MVNKAFIGIRNSATNYLNTLNELIKVKIPPEKKYKTNASFAQLIQRKKGGNMNEWYMSDLYNIKLRIYYTYRFNFTYIKHICYIYVTYMLHICDIYVKYIKVLHNSFNENKEAIWMSDICLIYITSNNVYPVNEKMYVKCMWHIFIFMYGTYMQFEHFSYIWHTFYI